MSVVIVDNGSLHVKEIEHLFEGWEVATIRYDDSALKDLDPSALVVLSGGSKHSLIGHLDEFTHELELIKSHEGPLIGICLGFEMMAHVYGSRLERRDERTQGTKEISLASEVSAILGKDTALVYEAHRWHVATVFEPLVTLAWSSDGIEMIRHQSRPHVGFQFHPEVEAGVDGKRIFDAALKSISVI